MAIVIPAPDTTKKAKAMFLGADFGRAFCEHFGLPAGQVLTVAPHADRDEIMHAKVEIALTPDDLAGIAAIMGGAKASEAPRLDRLPVLSMGVDPGGGDDMTVMGARSGAVEPEGRITIINNTSEHLDPERLVIERGG